MGALTNSDPVKSTHLKRIPPKTMKFFATSATLLGLTAAQKAFTGRCPEVHGTEDFNLDQYVATKWWNPLASPFMFNFPGISGCTTALYRPSESNPGFIDVINSQLLFNRWRYSAVGFVAPSVERNGELAVAFGGRMPDPEDPN